MTRCNRKYFHEKCLQSSTSGGQIATLAQDQKIICPLKSVQYIVSIQWKLYSTAHYQCALAPSLSFSFGIAVTPNRENDLEQPHH